MVGNDYLTFVSLPAFRGGRYGARMKGVTVSLAAA